ncbi:hypothetical protein BH11PSE1_BH11PSE1_10620 [soil metagenome]
MDDPKCHAATETPKEKARQLILKVLGAKRVAAWCSVGEATVYQWLGRGSDENPVPPAHVPAIIAGAKEAGLDAPMSVLWPAMAQAGAR